MGGDDVFNIGPSWRHHLGSLLIGSSAPTIKFVVWAFEDKFFKLDIYLLSK
jgi:hypothetical protein